MTGHEQQPGSPDDAQQSDDQSQHQFSLRRLFVVMTVCAVIFASLSVLAAPPEPPLPNGERPFDWLTLPVLPFIGNYDTIDNLGLLVVTLFFVTVGLFITMIVQLFRNRPRPWGFFAFIASLFVAFAIAWFSESVSERLIFRRQVTILLAGSFLCQMEVVLRRLGRKHWATVAVCFSTTLLYWMGYIFGMVVASA